MKHRSISILLCCALLLVLFAGTATADIGPKPSVVITFQGLAEETYYATLLAKEESSGPHSRLQEGHPSKREQYGSPEIFDKFAAYQDADGFHFLQYYQECTSSHRFDWGYYPPQEFKILLYFPLYDHFAVSGETYTQYAFDSYYAARVSKLDTQISSVNKTGNETTTAVPTKPAPPPVSEPSTAHGAFGTAAAEPSTAAPTAAGESTSSAGYTIQSVQETGEVTAKRNYNYKAELLALLVRIVLTIAVELCVALLFRLRQKRQLALLAVVNVVTQILLNVALHLINFQWGHTVYVLWYVLLEILVFALEALLYVKLLPARSEGPLPKNGLLVGYALAANAASFGFGLGLGALGLLP